MENLATWIPMMVAPLTVIALYELVWTKPSSTVEQDEFDKRHPGAIPQDNRNIVRELGFK